MDLPYKAQAVNPTSDKVFCKLIVAFRKEILRYAMYVLMLCDIANTFHGGEDW